MEVNRENFEEIFPQIRQSIEQCDFLAIDLEMTGLSAGKSERQRPWDSPQERYTKIKLGAAAVCPTQFGLCTFKWRSDLSQYEVHPYNIWIYPREYKNIDRSYSFQSSSLSFLRNHNFDFNKWIDQGVSWLSIEDHARIEGQLLKAFEGHAQRIAAKPESQVVPSEKDKEFLAAMWLHIDAWLIGKSKDKPLLLSTQVVKNGYQRLLIYQELPKKYPELYAKSATDAKGYKTISISKMNADEISDELEKNRDELKKEIEAAFGFGRVFQLITQAKKPLLGHNCFTDLAICYHHFMARIPNEAEAFTSYLHEQIPVIVDVKTIAARHPDLNGDQFSSTALGDLNEILIEKLDQNELPPVFIPKEFARYSILTKEALKAKREPVANSQENNSSSSEEASEKTSEEASEKTSEETSENTTSQSNDQAAVDNAYHEAGFDALLTGYNFLALACFFETGKPASTIPVFDEKQESDTNQHKAEPQKLHPRREIVHPYFPTQQQFVSVINSLNLMQINGTFNFGKAHDMPDLRTMYLLSELTDKDKNTDILAVFEHLGSIKINWIDSSSCVIQFMQAYSVTRDKDILRAPQRRWRIQRLTEAMRTEKFGKDGAKPLNPLSIWLKVSTSVIVVGCLLYWVSGAVRRRKRMI